MLNNFKPFKSWLTQISFLTTKDCSIFEPYLTTKTIKKSHYYLIEGKICKEMGFVNKGLFRTYYLLDGKEINTHFVFENQFVVEYDSFLREMPSKYFIQALEESEIVTFNYSALQNAYNQSQNWERFGRMMAEQSYKLITKRVENFLFLTGEERYLELLKSEPLVFNRVALYHIASYLGLERESLSRLRKKIAHKWRM